ncbi:MAG TPA: hypothetical protein VL860_09290 [Planctomycetota bacterium]|nr:hypothetical protein [Planctomycetota bacterium]
MPLFRRHSVYTSRLGVLLSGLFATLLSMHAMPAGETAGEAFAMDGWKVQVKDATAGGANQIFTHFTLKNQSGLAAQNVVLTLEVRDPSSNALAVSEKKTFATIKAGESIETQLAISAAAPNGEFRFRVAYPAPSDGRVKQICFEGGSAQNAPRIGAGPMTAPVSAAPEVSTTVAQPAAGVLEELTAGSWKVEQPKGTKDAVLIGSITNRTAAVANNVKVTVTLTKKSTDGSIAEVASLVVPSERPILPGTTVDLRGRIAECPAFDGVTATVDYDQPESVRSKALGTSQPDVRSGWAEGMAGGAQVEIGFDEANNDAKGNVVMRGILRNGTKRDVQTDQLKLEFKMPNGTLKKITADVRGKIPASTLCTVNLVVPGIGDFDRYTYELTFKR